MTTVCIVGAGAIGGYLAAHLAQAGTQVTLVARGAQLNAIRSCGLTLIENGAETNYRLRAVGRPADAGPHDVVVLGVKAHQIAPIAAELPALLHAGTTVVPMQNGIPWWYFHGLAGPHEGRRVDAVDPGGAIAAAIPAQSVVGCVVYPACEIEAPGLIRHVEGNRFPLGELDGRVTPRIEALSALFVRAGLKAPVLEDIRSEIWLKLWGNLAFNPISALTRSTLDRICAEPGTRSLAAGMMQEAQQVAESLGARFRVSIERRIEGAAKVGAHRTSMLQDVEAGRQTEIEALVGAVIELARLTATPVPRIEAVYACTRLLAA
ncbi:MAG TPA: 2-dehydropantoate 2-reductase [Burkholderiales bacterium]